MRNHHNVRRSLSVLLSTVFLGVLAGCSSGQVELSMDYKALDPDFRLAQSNQQVACMKDKGFTVLPDIQGGVEYGNEQVPEDQLELANQAIRDCYDELGFNDLPEITEAQLHKLYTLNLEAKKCLEGLKDYDFSFSEPPSEQSFVDSFNNPGNVPWSPWGQDMAGQLPGDAAEMDTIRRACPDPLNYVHSL